MNGRCAAVTWYVNPNTGRHDNDGQSSETAYRNLSYAIDAASSGDSVLLVPAAYYEDLPKLIAKAKFARITVSVIGAR